MRLTCALALTTSLLAASLACSSPNRGRWRGTFEGGVSGDMEFTVNARGTTADGRITGATRRGETFEASFRGSLNQGFLNAKFEGRGQTGIGLPAAFEGSLQGDLEEGRSEGTWTVDLIQARAHYEGRWFATQVAE
ncbi:MAG TPA: hypothetical protein VMS86_07400 [Thermoanaerobaculia bacterium]|nr:hypothetical protein [Thermoanaerobaculia bacterium]